MTDTNEIGDRSAVDRSKPIIQAAARVLMDAALDLIQADPHSWSERPCQTCAAVSTIAGRPFGCLTKNKIGGI